MKAKKSGKTRIFKDGAATALITPFKDGKIDYGSLYKIITHQLDGGIKALVVSGTTGEASTLTDEERISLIKFTKKEGGGIPVIAGSGSNNTARSVKLSLDACEAGCDALLVVTPYYNKANEEGLCENFLAVADACDKPMILYNVPSRTALSISIDAYSRLALHPRICAVKEASVDITAAAELFSACGEELYIYSGNDSHILPFLAFGGEGVISVLSNIIPKQTERICASFFEGNIEESRRLQFYYTKLIKLLFSDVNPIPVKAAAAMLGLCEEEYRLPLSPPSAIIKKQLQLCLNEIGFAV